MDCTEVFELINPSDHITFVATRSDAEVMATIFNESWMFVHLVGGDQLPILESDEFELRHGAIYNSPDNLERYAAAYASAMCATKGERETIDDAISKMPNPDDQKSFLENWQNRKRTSMNNICAKLHIAAESMMKKARQLRTSATP